MAEIGETPKEITQTEAHQTLEPKPLHLTFNQEDKAKTFCSLILSRGAPLAFREKAVDQLKSWRLVDTNLDKTNFQSYEDYLKLIQDAKRKASMARDSFVSAFALDPWNFDKGIEAEFSEEELNDFPRARELQAKLGDQTKFIFRAEPGQQYLSLVERENGERQVIKIVQTNRTAEEINQDAKKAPDILPPFEAISLRQGEVLLLIKWIDGHMPTTQEEKTLALEKAKELLVVPMELYDFWAGNFLITEFSGNDPEPKVFYVDSDIPITIAKVGMSTETASSRLPFYERDKARMK